MCRVRADSGVASVLGKRAINAGIRQIDSCAHFSICGCNQLKCEIVRLTWSQCLDRSTSCLTFCKPDPHQAKRVQRQRKEVCRCTRGIGYRRIEPAGLIFSHDIRMHHIETECWITHLHDPTCNPAQGFWARPGNRKGSSDIEVNDMGALAKALHQEFGLMG